MNHPRKVSAIKKHFSKPYQTLEEMRAGLKADESEYTDEEIEEIIEGIGQKAKEASQANDAQPAAALPVVVSEEELAEFKAWKEQKNALKPESTADLAKAIASPKASCYKDFDVFQGKVFKEAVANPFNPE